MTDLLVVPVYEGKCLPESVVDIDKALQGGVRYNMEREEFIGQQYQCLTMTTNGKHAISKLLIIGLGKREKLTSIDYQEMGGSIAAQLLELHIAEVALDGSGLDAEASACFALGIWLRRYSFNKYRNETPQPFSLKILCPSDKLQAYECLYKGIWMARELTSEPANILFPQAFAERC